MCLGSHDRLQLPGGQRVVLGQHNAPVRCVTYLPDRGLVVSGSWDQVSILLLQEALPVELLPCSCQAAG